MTLSELDHIEGPIAVMDGNCALCAFGARMIHRLDKTGEVRICPIQTGLGQALLAQHGLAPDDPDSWLLIDGDNVLQDFDAMIYLGERMGGFGRLMSALRLLPRPLRNWLYTRIARNRYAMFGHADLCALPDPSLRKRLIG